MGIVDRLIEIDRETPKRLLIVGDSMEDVWVHGRMESCQDGCAKFVQNNRTLTPGGAANAARQLLNWQSQAFLVGMTQWSPRWGFNSEMSFDAGVLPQKTRYLCDGKILFRHDAEREAYGMRPEAMREHQETILSVLHRMKWDAVLISDYDKGMLDRNTLLRIIDGCREKCIPVVADGKREPSCYYGAILKVNTDYARRLSMMEMYSMWRSADPLIITRGNEKPLLWRNGEACVTAIASSNGRPIVSHVGAGDCFAAHLVLALAHDLTLEDAVAVAHAAGQVYVQHEHGRPPWPFEIRRAHDPVGGKVIFPDELPALRQSTAGRIVFAPGVFRILTAGHCEMLSWARRQGDMLVVGVNDNVSAFRQRPEGHIRPVEERVAMLAALGAVDWVIPFGEDDGCATLRQLRADVVVKGHDRAGETIPEAAVCKEVMFSPPGAFNGLHATRVEEEIRL